MYDIYSPLISACEKVGLQYVVVCRSVLQCAAVCCSLLQCAAVCCSMLQCVAVYDIYSAQIYLRAKRWFCTVLCRVLVYCSVLQCVALCCSVLQCARECCRI